MSQPESFEKENPGLAELLVTIRHIGPSVGIPLDVTADKTMLYLARWIQQNYNCVRGLYELGFLKEIKRLPD